MMVKAKLNSKSIAIDAGDITVFNYDGETREYLSSSVEYLTIGLGIPSNSCVDVPNGVKEGVAVCRTTDGTAWEYIADHRGETVYSTKTGEEIVIAVLGDYPEDTTTLAPATSYDNWDDGQWITDFKAQQAADVAEAEQEKAALLAEATAIITPLADAQVGGYIDDADVPRLAEWQRYRYKLTKVNISTAPDITLPPKPEV